MADSTHQPNYSTVSSLINLLRANNRELCQELMNDADAKAFFGFIGYSELYLTKQKITFGQELTQSATPKEWNSDDWNNINISDTAHSSGLSKSVRFDRQMIELLTLALTSRFVNIQIRQQGIKSKSASPFLVPIADGIVAPSVTWKGYLLEKDQMFRQGEKAWNPLVVHTVFRQTNLNPYHSRKLFCEQITLALAKTSMPIAEQIELIKYNAKHFDESAGNCSDTTYLVLQISKHLAVFANINHLVEVYPLFAAKQSHQVSDLFKHHDEHHGLYLCLDRLAMVDIFCIPAAQIQKALKDD